MMKQILKDLEYVYGEKYMNQIKVNLDYEKILEKTLYPFLTKENIKHTNVNPSGCFMIKVKEFTLSVQIINENTFSVELYRGIIPFMEISYEMGYNPSKYFDIEKLKKEILTIKT